MLLIFVILYAFQYFFTDAVALVVKFPRQVTQQTCLCDQRSLWDIIRSCLLTISTCSWVSVHPNIPPKGELWWKKISHRLELVIWMIIFPEFMLSWALRQRIRARLLAENYREHGWTQTHGHFLQMGGFMLHNEDGPVRVLFPELFSVLLLHKKINMPSITEDEIQDRSKADALSKALVVVQITWFIIQLHGRIFQGLIVTQLEVATFAIAFLNGYVYYAWWNKPQDVQSTVPVYLNTNTDTQYAMQCMQEIVNRLSAEDQPLPQYDLSRLPSQAWWLISGLSYRRQAAVFSTFLNRIMELVGLRSHDYRFLSEVQMQDQPLRRHDLSRLASQAWWLISGVLYRWPAVVLSAFLKRLLELVGLSQDYRFLTEVRMHATTFSPTFLPSQHEVQLQVICYSALSAIFFGLIHVLPFKLFFPFQIEAKLWRIFSVTITVIPAVVFGILMVRKWARLSSSNNLMESRMRYLLIFSLLMYIPVRLAILIEPFILLKQLPPEALIAVKWTLYIPHI